MSTSRTCPHCGVVIQFEFGFHYDEKLNLVCDGCNKIVLPTNESDESAAYTVKSDFNRFATNQYNPHASQSSMPSAASYPAGRGSMIDYMDV